MVYSNHKPLVVDFMVYFFLAVSMQFLVSSLPMSITSYEVIFESLGGNTFGDYSADKSTL